MCWEVVQREESGEDSNVIADSLQSKNPQENSGSESAFLDKLE